MLKRLQKPRKENVLWDSVDAAEDIKDLAAGGALSSSSLSCFCSAAATTAATTALPLAAADLA